MAFTRVNPLGWALFEELTSAQMNQLDLNMVDAIDGVNGGTYNLAAPLTLNGGPVTIENLAVTGATFDTLTVVSDLNLNGANVNGDFELTGTCDVSGTLSVSGILNVPGRVGPYPSGKAQVFTVTNSDLVREGNAGTTYTLDPDVEGSKFVFDCSACDQPGWLDVSVGAVAGGYDTGLTLEVIVVQSQDNFGIVTWVEFPSNFGMRGQSDELQDETMCDPRRGSITRWKAVWIEQAQANGAFITTKESSMDSLLGLSTNPPDYPSFGSGWLGKLDVDPTPRRINRAMSAPKSVLGIRPADPTVFPEHYFPISRLVYSPSTQALWAVVRSADPAQINNGRWLAYSLNGSTWTAVHQLDATQSTAARGFIACAPSGTLTTNEDVVFFTGSNAPGAGQVFERRIVRIQGGDGWSVETAALSGIGTSAQVVGRFAYSHARERFIYASNFRVSTYQTSGASFATLVSGDFVDVACKPDGTVFCAAANGDIYRADGLSNTAVLINNTEFASADEIIGIGYGWARNMLIVVWEDGGNIFVSYSYDDGVTFVTSVNSGGAWSRTSRQACEVLGVGGGVLIAFGNQNQNSDPIFMFTLSGNTNSFVWKNSQANLGEWIQAGCAWLNGHLVFPCNPSVTTGGYATPQTVMSQYVGPFSVQDFDR